MSIGRAIVVLTLAAQALHAQERDIAATADSIFARWNTTHAPGCAVGIARDGRVILTRGYGMANLETGSIITPETVFESGSVAKQFTAAAVVLLALDGRLSLDDEARKYVPEMPAYERPITIRHLLTHTSGLREWSSSWRFRVGRGDSAPTRRPTCSTSCSARSPSTTPWVTSTATPTPATPSPQRSSNA